jgi:hypothetical protein
LPSAPVLFVDCEAGIRALSSRTRLALANNRAPADLALYLSAGTADLVDLPAIGNQALAVKAGLVILDNPGRLPFELSSASIHGYLPYLLALHDLAAQTNAAVLVLVHTLTRRSTLAQALLAAGASHVLAVDAPFGQPQVHIRTVAAVPTQAPISVSTIGPYDRWKLPRNPGKPKSITPLGEAGYEVLAYIHSKDQASTRELQARITAAVPTRTRTLLHELVLDGYLIRSNIGGRGQPASYSLTPAGRHVLG